MTRALLLVAHGSARHPDSAAPLLALADAIAARGAWDHVSAAFMRQDPLLSEALDAIAADEVVVVPVFAGKGYYTDQLIPKAMGLDGAVTLRGTQRIFYTTPAGGDARIPGLMACRADGVAREGGWAPGDASLLLIAHGSARPGGSGDTPRAIAAAIAAYDHFAEVALVFLEQEPFATAWPDRVRGDKVVALPLLVAQGMHASQDIPALFGLESGQVGPVLSHGRTVRLATGLGAEPDLVDIIASMADGALGLWQAAEKGGVDSHSGTCVPNPPSAGDAT